MSKKRSEINPIRAERVKTIIKEEKLTQKSFAERIFYTQQHVSRICNCKMGLDEQMANAIINAFPRYRLAWLMGYDDFKTEIENNTARENDFVNYFDCIDYLMLQTALQICDKKGVTYEHDPIRLHFLRYIIADYLRGVMYCYLQEDNLLYNVLEKHPEVFFES